MDDQTSKDIPIEGCLLHGFLPPKFKCKDQVLRLDLSCLGMNLPKDAYAIQVRDDAMIEAGILPGDIAILAPGLLRRGDIVAICEDGQICLRRYVMIMNIPHLLAEHPTAPGLVAAHEVTTYGALCSLVRTTGLWPRLQRKQPEVNYPEHGPLKAKDESLAEKRAIFQKLGLRLQQFGINERLLSDPPPAKGYRASSSKKSKR